MSTEPRRLVDDPDAPALARLDLGIASHDPTVSFDVAAGLERLRASLDPGGGDGSGGSDAGTGGGAGTGGAGASTSAVGAAATGGAAALVPALSAGGVVLVLGAIAALIAVRSPDAGTDPLAEPVPTGVDVQAPPAPGTDQPRSASAPPVAERPQGERRSPAATVVAASTPRGRHRLAAPASVEPSVSARRASVAAPTLRSAPEPRRSTPTAQVAPPPSEAAAPEFASSAAVAPASTTASAVGPRAEIAQLAIARRALVSGDAGRALKLAEDGHSQFPRGLLYEEREAIAIEALADLGLAAEARARGKRYLARFPNGTQSERVRRAITK